MTRRFFVQAVGAVLAYLGLQPLPVEAEPQGFACPQCRRPAHYCCSNHACTCWKDVPAGELPLRDSLEHVDVLECPYCGHAMHIDWWFDEFMDAIGR